MLSWKCSSEHRLLRTLMEPVPWQRAGRQVTPADVVVGEKTRQWGGVLVIVFLYRTGRDVLAEKATS